jgi:hypothetical protein
MGGHCNQTEHNQEDLLNVLTSPSQNFHRNLLE